MQITIEKGRVSAIPETPAELRMVMGARKMVKSLGQQAAATEPVECDICHKVLKSAMGLKVHKAHMHRQA